MWGMAGPFEYSLPAERSGGLRIVTVGGRWTGGYTPAGAGSGGTITAVRHQQKHRHAVATGGQCQATRCCEVGVFQFCDNKRCNT